MYKLTENGVTNLDTGANIPDCPDNADWQNYQAWAKKNTPFSIESVIEKINGVWTTDLSDEKKAEIAEQEKQEQALKNITKRQLLIWLFLKKSKTEDDIYSAINVIADADKKYLAKVNYSGTNNFYYGNSFVPVIGQALGLTLDEIKTMFDEAKEM